MRKKTGLRENPIWQRAEKMRTMTLKFAEYNYYIENVPFLFFQCLNGLYLNSELKLGVKPVGNGMIPGGIMKVLKMINEKDDRYPDHYADIVFDLRSFMYEVENIIFYENMEMSAANFLKRASKDFPDLREDYIVEFDEYNDDSDDTYEDIRIALDIDTKDEWKKCVLALCNIYAEGTSCLEACYTNITIREMPELYSEYILHPERFRVSKKDKKTIQLFHKEYVMSSGLFLFVASNTVYQTKDRLFVFATTGCNCEGRELYEESIDVASIIQMQLIMELLESCRVSTLEDKKCMSIV